MDALKDIETKKKELNLKKKDIQREEKDIKLEIARRHQARDSNAHNQNSNCFGSCKSKIHKKFSHLLLLGVCLHAWCLL